MKIGIFSDIHGNRYAFEKIFQQLRAATLDRYVFCGDLCGYYYDQNAIVDMLESLPGLVSVMGNHDQTFLNSLTDSQVLQGYTQKYGNSLLWLRETVTPKALKFIQDLPESHLDRETGMAVFHGSPWNPLEEYIYPTDSVDRFEEVPYRYVLLGHTHYAMERQVKGVRIINPGSCGQPRDGRLPSYAVLDTDRNSVSIERVAYDPAPLMADIKRYEETNPYLSEVLTR